MQKHPAVRVEFELATDGIQFYVFANEDKTSLSWAQLPLENENFDDQCPAARVEGVIGGRDAAKKVRERLSNLKFPVEFEYEFSHLIFQDTSASPR